MALVIICPNKKPELWRNAIHAIDPDIDIRIWPDYGNPDDIIFALSWQHPSGVFNQFPHLKTISSMGAGVDHIIFDDSIAADIAIARVIDENLCSAMSDYLLACLYSIKQHLFRYQHDQQQAQWHPRKPYPELHVGVMGLGEIGSFVCQRLQNSGFKVSGWAQSQHQIENVHCFLGEADKNTFLQNLNVLICLLPLTKATTGILNDNLFQSLPQGAHIINVARGDHLVEKDLLNNMTTGQIRSAILDVFQQEPLPSSHPFWNHPQIVVTPHISSLSQPESIAAQIVTNYHHTVENQSLIHHIDRIKGY